MKVCIKCGKKKPFSEFYPKKDSSSGYQSDCKECRREYARQYYQNNRATILEKTSAYSKTDKGKEVKRQHALSEKGQLSIHRYKSSEKAKQTRREYASSEEGKETLQRYRDSGRRKEVKRRYESSEKGRRATREYQKKYFQTERGRAIKNEASRHWANSPKGKEYHKQYGIEYREANKQAERDRQKKWSKTEKGRINNRLKSHNRRARGAGYVKVADVLELKKTQNGRCFYCGCVLDDSYHIDHKDPVSRGGKTEVSNLVLTCPTCNLTKMTQTAEEFMERRAV